MRTSSVVRVRVRVRFRVRVRVRTIKQPLARHSDEYWVMWRLPIFCDDVILEGHGGLV